MLIAILILTLVCVIGCCGWFRRYVNLMTLFEYMNSVNCPPPDEKDLKECETIALREILRKIVHFE